MRLTPEEIANFKSGQPFPDDNKKIAGMNLWGDIHTGKITDIKILRLIQTDRYSSYLLEDRLGRPLELTKDFFSKPLEKDHCYRISQGTILKDLGVKMPEITVNFESTIYIKPAQPLKYIKLNFIVTPTGLKFRTS